MLLLSITLYISNAHTPQNHDNYMVISSYLIIQDICDIHPYEMLPQANSLLLYYIHAFMVINTAYFDLLFVLIVYSMELPSTNPLLFSQDVHYDDLPYTIYVVLFIYTGHIIYKQIKYPHALMDC
jgi:hypothetical protein